MKKRSLGFNTFLNGIRSVLNIIFPLITFPYVSRVLSVQSIGIYNFSNTYISYFVLLAGLGINTYAIREASKYRDNQQKLNLFSNQIFTINILSTIIAYILLLVSLLVFKTLSNYISCILIFSLQIFFTTLGTEWIYTIYEDFTYITMRSILFQILSIALLFIFVKRPDDYLIYAGITVFASVGANILNFLHTKSFINIKLVKKPRIDLHLKPILIIFVSSVATTLYVSSDTTILGILKDDYAVGIYSVAVKIYTIINGLVGGLLTATIPRLSRYFGKGMLNEYNRTLSKVINGISILVLPAAVGVIMLSKEVIIIIAGSKYLDSALSLQIIVITLIFSIFSIIFTYCVLIPAKREKLVLRNTIIVGVGNVLLNFVFIPIWSYDGAAFTTVVSEIMIVSMDAWAAKDIIKPIVFSKDFFKNIISSIVGCIGIVLICWLCNINFRSLIGKTIFSILLSIPMYFSILVLLRNKVAINIAKYFRNKI